jgi:pantetheine-phosphate adenylyltransferase
MHRAVYPGTFDPVTLGHIDLLRHATALFDEVTVAILHNPNKQPLFQVEERIEFVQQATRHLKCVKVASFTGLLVNYVKAEGFDVVVRGIRNSSDLQVEMQMAQMNESLYPEIHTIFLPTAPKFSFVSSSLVKDVAMHGGDVSQFVTAEVEAALRGRLRVDSVDQ